MINDYVHRSPLAPPIIIVWHFYEAYKAIGNQCASLRNAETAKYNPFCKSICYFFLTILVINVNYDTYLCVALNCHVNSMYMIPLFIKSVCILTGS